jgi:Mg2+ and Co2+ transporter CorA
VFHRFEHRHLDDLKPALRLRAGKLAQRLDGLDHTIVEMRERSRLLQEELHLKIEEQGNDNIRVLSVLTALLMPPTLVTGIFGMNTKGLPFHRSRNGLPVGSAAVGPVVACRVFHHEAHRDYQVARAWSRGRTTADAGIA